MGQSHYKLFQVHMRVSGRTIHMSEYMGEMGRFANDMELDHEVPFRVPGDKEGTGKLGQVMLC